MKNLFLIAIVIFTLQTNAQEQNHQDKKSFFKDLSAEQMAALKTKKMTLHLDLTNDQQDKIYKMNLDVAKDRKSKMEKFQKRNKDTKPSSDEMYQRKMDRLDKQMEQKKTLQSILDKEQFEKWEKMKMLKGKKKHLRKTHRKN